MSATADSVGSISRPRNLPFVVSWKGDVNSDMV